VLALNHRIAVEDVRGELDVVAFEPRTRLLVVCEVKARSDRAGGSGRGRGPGGALVALGPRQQARIRRMTAVLLASGTLRASRVRFDLVAVDVSSTSGRAELAHVADAW
jgi:Holliday junction resolvase-like predicted endonuclease